MRKRDLVKLSPRLLAPPFRRRALAAYIRVHALGRNQSREFSDFV